MRGGRERGKKGKEGEGERGFGSLCPCCHRYCNPFVPGVCAQIKCSLSHAIDLIVNKRRAAHLTVRHWRTNPRLRRRGFRPRSPKGQEAAAGHAFSARRRASGSAGRSWRPAAARGGARSGSARAARAAARSAAASAAGMKRVRPRVHVAVAVRAPAACTKKRCGTIRCRWSRGAGHRHVEQPALFLDLLVEPVRQVGRDAAVDRVEHVHRLPFLALGRVDGRQDQVVLVEQRRARPGRWWRRADPASARSGSARASG